MTSPVSDERLNEMLAGLEGVTPGPWEVVGNSITDWGREWEASARCDPDTIRYLVTQELSRRSLDTAGGVEGDYDAYDECATDGCSNPGTLRFEGGGVGSDYCPTCFEKIAALSRPSQNAEVAAALRHAAAEGYRVCAETRHVTLGDRVRDAILALTPPAVSAGEAEPLPTGDDDDITLATAARKHNIGSVERLVEVLAELRGYRAAPLPQVDEGMIERALDPVALEQAIASVEQRLMGAVDAHDRGWQRLDRDGWEDRIRDAFKRIRSYVPRLVNPEVEHARWMENRYYRSGFELHGQGKGRNDSPYIAGCWTDQWQMGWDYADRLAALNQPGGE